MSIVLLGKARIVGHHPLIGHVAKFAVFHASVGAAIVAATVYRITVGAVSSRLAEGTGVAFRAAGRSVFVHALSAVDMQCARDNNLVKL